jgi:hypothetical protein
MTNEVLKQTIRDAGGIVHSDGNIFFTNADQFQRAAIAAASAVPPPDFIFDPTQESIADAAKRFEFAKSKAVEWHGQAGGELLPQLTANELAGILNEVASGTAMQPLTDAQVEAIVARIGFGGAQKRCNVYEFAKHVQAAHGITKD